MDVKTRGDRCITQLAKLSTYSGSIDQNREKSQLMYPRSRTSYLVCDVIFVRRRLAAADVMLLS